MSDKRMLAAVYKGNGNIELEKRDLPKIVYPEDAIVQVTLTTICSSDIHIKHGSVPKAKILSLKPEAQMLLTAKKGGL